MSDASANPAPQASGATPEAAPVKWGEILQSLRREVERADRWRASLAHDLAADAVTPEVRDTLQSAIARHDRRAEVFAAAWRFIWHLRTDDRLRERLGQVIAAERAISVPEAGDDDEIRYE